ncbi:MAG: T9SS type A sorting domain-containing protein [Bacteroidia bacterium]|nr:T9SS type A sorting domain-containing protein [Bacteroidia bacterium]
MKYYLLVLIFLLSVCTTSATHLAAGNISVLDLGNGNCEITISLSRDTTTGSSALNQIKYFFEKDDGSIFYSRNISFQLIPGSPLNGHPQNVELYQAKDTVNFLTPGDYRVYIQKCCMPGPFNNASINRVFYIDCKFRVFANGVENSSPQITNPSINVIPVNQSFTYNVNAYDLDDDVVRIYSIHPLEADSVQIPFYVDPSSDSTNVFHVDSVSGDLVWTPNQIGRFLVSFEIQEIRNRKTIGRTIRTQTFIVLPDSNHIPIINNFSAIPVDANGYKCVQINPQQNYSLTLFAHDLDMDSLNMLAYGEPFELNNNQAMFIASPLPANQLQGVFSWTPDSSAVRLEKYKVTFRIVDEQYARDYTLFIKVGNLIPGASELEEIISSINLYPNPVQNKLNVDFSLISEQNIYFRITDNSGREMVKWNSELYSKGKQTLELPINLNDGIYYLEVLNENRLLKTMPLLVLSK